MRSITAPIPEATQQADDEAFLPEFCPNPGWIAHQGTLSTVARNVCNLMQRLLLYRIYHNHFKAFRHRMPDHTHAAMAGIDESIGDH